MLKLAGKLSMLFADAGFLERFAAAAAGGFRAVEYQYPYDWPAQEIAARVHDAGVQVVLHNMPRGDPERGEHGTACLPGREPRFRADLERAVEYARAVGCERLHCMAGVAPTGFERKTIHKTYVDNLKYAPKRLGAEGMQVMIEPLTARPIAGCFLTRIAQPLQVLGEAAA